MSQMNRRRFLRLAGATAAGAALWATGCSSSTPTPGTSAGPTFTPATTPRTINVAASNYKFDPANIQVAVGEPVLFVVTNTSDILHTFTVKLTKDSTDNLFSLDLPPGGPPQQQLWTFDTARAYYLYCIYHEALGMVGSIEAS